MKLLAVVCRVEDDGVEKLHNIEPAIFLDMLAASQESEADDLATLEAELAASRQHQEPATPVNAIPEGSSFVNGVAVRTQTVEGLTVLPRAVAEPIVTAKTRGEVYEKLDELLSQFGARLAREGE